MMQFEVKLFVSEAVVMQIEVKLFVPAAVLLQIEVHSSVAEVSEKSRDNAQLRQSFSGPKFKAWNFQIRGRRVKH
jgi:hypothetical protein